VKQKNNLSSSSCRRKRLRFSENNYPQQKGNQSIQTRAGGLIMKYDNEEEAIVDAYKKGKMKLSTPTEKEIGEIRAMARKTLVKDKRITIRLYDHDYLGIQKKAIEMGIPYQTLISGIIHQYIRLLSKVCFSCLFTPRNKFQG
jgi:predicted DNA binding CopG/RHH family protein